MAEAIQGAVYGQFSREWFLNIADDRSEAIAMYNEHLSSVSKAKEI
jgi:hypothetical protein